VSENHDWRTKATMDSATRAVDAVLRPGPANGRAATRESDDSDAAFMVGLWDGLDDLREMPGYPDLLGTPTWRERLVKMRAHLAAVAKPIAWFTLPAGAAAALAFYALAPSPS
jgi:hypothetical protein